MTRRAASIGLLLVSLGGCLDQADSAKLAAAQTRFFAQWQARQYGAIYDGAAPDLTGTMTRDAFIAMMQTVDAKMGACQPPVKQFDYHFVANDKGAFASQGWSSTCASGKLDETLTIVLRDGVAKVAGFNFKNPVLQGDQPVSTGVQPATSDAD